VGEFFMPAKELNLIAESFASNVIECHNQFSEDGRLFYYFAGSIAAMLFSNAVTVQDYNVEQGTLINSKKEIPQEIREFMQANFPRSVKDVDIVIIPPGSENDYAMPFANYSFSAFFDDSQSRSRLFHGSNFWHNLNNRGTISSHCASEITTEKGNKFYITRPDYQLAYKISEATPYLQDRYEKTVRDAAIMFLVCTEMHTKPQLFKAFKKALAPKSVTHQGEIVTVKSLFEQLALDMINYLKRNVSNPEESIKRIQEMSEYIAKTPISIISSLNSARTMAETPVDPAILYKNLT
jgi:hypothetical protein